jgi:hypothetical protein
MNPLTWKREHQLAFLLAIALGALLGLLVGINEVSGPHSFRWGALWCERTARGANANCTYLLTGYGLLVFTWVITGALVAATMIYIRQLLRA